MAVPSCSLFGSSCQTAVSYAAWSAQSCPVHGWDFKKSCQLLESLRALQSTRNVCEVALVPFQPPTPRRNSHGLRIGIVMVKGKIAPLLKYHAVKRMGEWMLSSTRS